MKAPPDPGPRKGAGPIVQPIDPVGNVKAGSLDGRESSDPGAGRQPDLHRARLGHEAPPPPKFRTLLIGHHPEFPPVATLVLAAMIAVNGRTASGGLMPGSTDDDSTFDAGRPATLRAIANELGVHIDAARRGAKELEIRNVATRYEDGLVANPDAVAALWTDHRRRIRLTAEDRRRGLRAEPLLLVGLIHGQSRNGRLTLGLGYLAERTGMPRRTLQRCLATAAKADAIHRWTAPLGRGQLVIGIGPSQSGARVASQSGARVGHPRPVNQVETGGGHREVAHPPSQSGAPTIVNRRTPHREVAHAPPDVHPEYPPDSPPDSTAAAALVPAGETGSVPLLAAAEPQPAAELTPKAKPKRDPIAEVERWVVAFAKRGIETMVESHAFDVAGLLDLLGSDDGIRDHAAVRADRRKLAGRAIAWCPSPERLAQWLVSVRREFGAKNLAGYLRAAVDNGGDPGTLLGSHLRNVYGQGAEQFQHFTPATEQALEGPHVDAVAAIVDATGSALRLDDMGHRAALRYQLQQMLASGRNGAARKVLLQLVGDDRSDIAVTRAIGDVCTLDVARQLLGVA